MITGSNKCLSRVRDNFLTWLPAREHETWMIVRRPREEKNANKNPKKKRVKEHACCCGTERIILWRVRYDFRAMPILLVPCRRRIIVSDRRYIHLTRVDIDVRNSYYYIYMYNVIVSDGGRVRFYTRWSRNRPAIFSFELVRPRDLPRTLTHTHAHVHTRAYNDVYIIRIHVYVQMW